MKIYSRDVHEQEFINEKSEKLVRRVCAPCYGHPCIPLEVDNTHSSACKTQFVDEKGTILGFCECFAHHVPDYDVFKTPVKSYPPELDLPH